MRLDDAVAFGVEGDDADGRPVSGVARPAGRVKFASPGVERMSGSQYREIVACMTLSRTDVTNTTVTMINVVPVHEASCPGARLFEIGKALGGELRPVLGGAKQRFGVRVVVADTGSQPTPALSPSSSALVQPPT